MIWFVIQLHRVACCFNLCCCCCSCSCRTSSSSSNSSEVYGSGVLSKSTVQLVHAEKKSQERERKQSKAEKITELLQNTEFSLEELKKWHKKFKRENPSGKVTCKEIKEILASRFPDGDPEQAALRVMQIFDQDQNGYLDFYELVTALSVARKGSREDKLKLAFNMADTDSSGTIDLNEMTELMNALHKLVGVTVSRFSLVEEDTPMNHALKMMKEFDLDNDNEVTFKEFCEGVERNPNLAVLITNFASPEMICSDFVN